MDISGRVISFAALVVTEITASGHLQARAIRSNASRGPVVIALGLVDSFLYRLHFLTRYKPSPPSHVSVTYFPISDDSFTLSATLELASLASWTVPSSRRDQSGLCCKIAWYPHASWTLLYLCSSLPLCQPSTSGCMVHYGLT